MKALAALAAELAGLAGLSYGLWLAWHPLGFIGGGVCAILIGLGINGGER